MSASLAPRTRDGAPSVAFLLEDRGVEFAAVEADAATIAAWAKANQVNLNGPGGKMARINAARLDAGLPAFVAKASPVMVSPPPPRSPPPKAYPATPKASDVRVLSVGEGDAPGHPVTTPEVAQVTQHAAPVSLLRTIKSEDEFLDLVTSFDGTVTVLCTPELAGWALAINTGNRPLQSAQVERFRRILRSGSWVNTGEPVILSVEGVLNDGQHRLSAIRDTGIAAEVDIRFGVARAAFHATGTGARRTLGNILSISGRQHASALAAVARLLHHYDAGTMARSNQQVEGNLVLGVVEQEQHLPAIAAWMSKSKFAPTRTAPFGLVLAVAARHWPLDRVLVFGSVVTDGQAEQDDAGRLLHVRLRDAAMAKERLHQTDVAALGVRAINAWLGGQKLHHLKLLATDRTNEGFPRVVAP